MKKNGFIMTIILSLTLLSGCESPTYTKAKNNIAEIRNNIYAGENESIKATFMTGEREKEYVINGKATQLIEFGVITFYLTGNNVTFAKTGNYKMIIEGKTFEGELQLNPFDNTYVADLGKNFETKEDIVVQINIGSFENEIKLSLQNGEWLLNSIDALELACKVLKTQLKDYNNETWTAEVYIKIIHDEEVSSDKYFWYVSFVGQNGINHSVIIEPNTKEILAKK